jgi:hypothetical protein
MTSASWGSVDQVGLLDAIKAYFGGFELEVVDPNGSPRPAGRPRMSARFVEATIEPLNEALVLGIKLVAENGNSFVIYLSEETLVPARESDPRYSYEQLIAEQLIFLVQESIVFGTPIELHDKVLF